MSRTKWLIVAALALADVIVLGAMAIVVFRFMQQLPSAPASIPTSVAVPQPGATLPPTWTPTVNPTPAPTRTPRATGTPAPTRTPRATGTPAPTSTPWPTPTATLPPTPVPVVLDNPTFDGVVENSIPGWRTGAFVNWTPGDEFDPANSYAAPRFQQAGDSRQWIDGPTLQVSTEPWVKLRAWVFQTVVVQPGSRVRFQVRAMGFVKDLAGGYILKAGVDPNGGEGCEAARWGDERIANQEDGVVELASPEVTAGQAGTLTICMFAETQFAQVYHAAFFDDAALTVRPPALP